MSQKLARSSLTFMASACFASQLHAAPAAPLLATIDIQNPAFLQIFDGKQSGNKDLIVSSFSGSLFGKSSITRLSYDSPQLQDIGQVKPSILTQKITWPNDATQVPAAIFGEGYIAVGAGFLVPTKSTGTASILNLDTGESFPIAAPKKDYFYHRILFADINSDGRLDAVTARAKVPLFGGSTDGELLWLEQNENDPKGFWKEHIITQGPDTHFILHDFDGDGRVEIVSAEFFAKKLSIQWQEDGRWVSHVIDAKIGSAFDLELADLNGDGKLDLLATNHEADASASIFAYEIPDQFKTAEWTRHTLLDKITTEKDGKNQASPGSAFAIQPDSRRLQAKSWIIAAGDGSTRVHRLIATSDDPQDWTYSEDIIHDGKSTIGKIAIDDINQDGRKELFVPAYHDSKIFVFQL